MNNNFKYKKSSLRLIVIVLSLLGFAVYSIVTSENVLKDDVILNFANYVGVVVLPIIFIYLLKQIKREKTFSLELSSTQISYVKAGKIFAINWSIVKKLEIYSDVTKEALIYTSDSVLKLQLDDYDIDEDIIAIFKKLSADHNVKFRLLREEV